MNTINKSKKRRIFVSEVKGSGAKTLFVAIVIVAVIAGVYVLNMAKFNGLLGIGDKTASATMAPAASASTLTTGGTDPATASPQPAAADASTSPAATAPAADTTASGTAAGAATTSTAASTAAGTPTGTATATPPTTPADDKKADDKKSSGKKSSAKKSAG
jgi:cytoskeletal protein RodZ